MRDIQDMTDTDFDRVLGEICDEHTGRQLLTIPGAYEVFSEHFNNEVLEKWEHEEDEREPKKVYKCPRCKGSNVVTDGNAEWDVDRQQWVLRDIFDDAYCCDCETDIELVEEVKNERVEEAQDDEI